MNILYWNARGLGNLDTRLVLKNLCQKHKPDLLFISKPNISFTNFPTQFWRQLGLKSFCFNLRSTNIPNLWGFCNENIDPIILSISDQHVSFSLMIDHKMCHVSAVYGSTSHVGRRKLWMELNSLQQRYNGPWCFIGDFNAILGAHEKAGRHLPNKTSCDEFRGWSDLNNLIHLDIIGNQFTWSNGRRGNANTYERLDRAICNTHWIDFWKTISCCTLSKSHSDHHPILLNLQTEVNSFPSSFKFQKMWTTHEDCKRVIHDHWAKEVVGCPMHILKHKLKTLKPVLKIWNKDVFGNVQQNVDKALATVNDIQNKINVNGYSDDYATVERNAQKALDTALNQQEQFWKDKSRVQWLIEGDRNTSYFHRLTKIRHATNKISRLQRDGNFLESNEEIEQHALSYFQDLFASDNMCSPTDIVSITIPSLVTQADNDMI
jgi:hypothetical protein